MPDATATIEQHGDQLVVVVTVTQDGQVIYRHSGIVSTSGPNDIGSTSD